MSVVDGLALGSLICIWTLLLVNVSLTVAGYIYYWKTERRPVPELKDEDAPMVSILVPAHNEAVVIAKTMDALLGFDYPADRYEVIVVNDNSTDRSAEILADIQKNNPGRIIKVINTDAQTGGKGKSNALNIAFAQAVGDFLVIYDADNTPERPALRYLVAEITNNRRLGAVIGKFRTRNRNASILTRFINIETLAFQWMAQAGRWQLFRLCTIPGTNFIVRRELIEKMGGWDVQAIAEDTEISFRIYMEGYVIKFQPKAVTWEQEPQTLPVWFRQRTRWVKGNIYVIFKNIPLLFKRNVKRIKFDILYFLSIYTLLLASLISSDIIFIGNAMGLIHPTLAGFSTLLWLMAILLFVVSTFITLTTEQGEMSWSNLFLVVLMYFSYSLLWIIVAAYGFIMYLVDILFKRETKWYKTERFS